MRKIADCITPHGTVNNKFCSTALVTVSGYCTLCYKSAGRIWPPRSFLRFYLVKFTAARDIWCQFVALDHLLFFGL